MSIILVRHGETPLNAARVMQPPTTALSQRGLEQAGQLAQRLQTMRPHALMSSDMPRAWQTAEQIATLTGLTIECSPLLRERNFGDLRGLPYDSLGFDPLNMDEAPSNGESKREFEQRVTQAFEVVLARRASLQGDIVVVTHGLWIKTMLDHLAQTFGQWEVPHRIGNTAVTILAQDPPHAPRLLNCTRHLDTAGMSEAGSSLSGG